MNTVYFITNFHGATYTGEYSAWYLQISTTHILCLYGACSCSQHLIQPIRSLKLSNLLKASNVHGIIYSEVTIFERHVGFLYPDPGYEGGTGSDSSMFQFAMVVVLWIIIALLLFLFR